MKESEKYQTPINVVNYMVSLIPKDSIKILEPTKGDGNILNVLIKKGYDVDSPEDYFLLNSKNIYDCIVMNPPFSSKSANLKNAPERYINSGMKTGYFILNECMLKSNNIISLMPWFTISDSDVRIRKIKRFGLKSITLLPRKTFNYARIQTMVLNLEKGFNGETKFIVLDTINDELQKKLL